MKIRVYSTEIGHATLSDEHAASSYGQFVLVGEDGTTYGTADIHGYLHVDIDEPPVDHYENTVPMYRIDGREVMFSDLPRVTYTAEELDALRRLVVDAWTKPYGQHFGVGATIQALFNMPEIVAEAEQAVGHKIARNR